MRIRHVERLGAAEENYAQAILRQEPVVFAKACSTWPAITKWTRRYLLSTLGDARMLLRRRQPDTHPFESTLGSYIEDFWPEADGDQPARRLMAAEIWPEFFIVDNVSKHRPAAAHLAEDIAIPDAVGTGRMAAIPLWLGGQYTNPNHYDVNGCDNFNFSLKGNKMALLFHPDDLDRMAPEPAIASRLELLWGGDSQIAQGISGEILKIEDVRTDPAFRDVDCWQAEWLEGDMLFIPAFWWHWVTSRAQVNMNISMWFESGHARLSRTSAQWAFLNAVWQGSGKNMWARTLRPEALEAFQSVESAFVASDNPSSPLAALGARAEFFVKGGS